MEFAELEAKIAEYVTKCDFAKDVNEDKKIAKENLEALIDEKGINNYTMTLDDGRKVTISKTAKVVNKLDKDVLSVQLGVAAKDLTTENLIHWVEEGKLSSSDYEGFIYTDVVDQIKIKVK